MPGNPVLACSVYHFDVSVQGVLLWPADVGRAVRTPSSATPRQKAITI